MFCVKRITETSTYLKSYFQQARLRRNSSTGHNDIDCYLALDSTGGYRHLGAYFIEQEYRKQGYGSKLFDEVIKRSEPFVKISIYASLAMVKLYKKYFGSVENLYPVNKHDFNLITALENIKGAINHTKHTSYQVKHNSDVDFKSVCEYDKFIYGYDRQEFLHKWLYSPGSYTSFVVNDDGAIVGYAVAREMGESLDGYRIGPLFGEDISVAKALTQSVLEKVKAQGTLISNSMYICAPIGINPQVPELLNLLVAKCVNEFVFMTTNGPPKGRTHDCFEVTSLLCG